MCVYVPKIVIYYHLSLKGILTRLTKIKVNNVRRNSVSLSLVAEGKRAITLLLLCLYVHLSVGFAEKLMNHWNEF